MGDFSTAVVALFVGWCFGFCTVCLIDSFRILKEIKSRHEKA